MDKMLSPNGQELSPDETNIINYMKRHGSLTNHSAITFLKVGSFHRRLTDLRKKGYVFDTEWAEGVSDERRYRKYRLRDV